jgi:hypothetical protein
MGADWAIYPIAFFVCTILSRDILAGADVEYDPVSGERKWWAANRRQFLLFWLTAWVLGGGLWGLSHY